jgi:hypothetical protein
MLAVAAILGLSGGASAATLSYAGYLTNDDDVALFRFVVNQPATATIRTFSYAGGTQANGDVVPAGGFDPIISLFDGHGNFIDDNNDGPAGTVPADPTTGEKYDALLTHTLAPGAYFAAISQYDNFFDGAPGENIAQGYEVDGDHFFTDDEFGCAQGQFCDDTNDSRGDYFAFDVQLANAPAPVPLPPALPLLGSALAALGFVRRKRTA